MNNKQLKSHDFADVYKWLGINLNKLGCVMLDVEPLESMRRVENYDVDVALYYAKNKERFWIDGWVADKVAHITLLYGLLEEGKNYEPHIQKVLSGWKLENVEIESVGYFDSPYPDEPYYCIIAHIKVTPELLEGHQRLEFLPHVNTFATYKPHMTICYISKEQGEVYRDMLIAEFNTIWAEKKLNIKEEINLGGNK
jgi:hypothetical protein